MKNIARILFACLLTWTVQSQSDYSKSLDGIEWVKIESKSSVSLKTHNKKEIRIVINDLKPIPEKAKGLQLLGDAGEDNTAVGFNVSTSGNNLIVKNVRRSGEAVIFLPKSQNISVTNSWGGTTEIAGFSGEVEANSNLNGALVLSNLTGAVTAYSLNHGIQVNFTEINQNSPIDIRTTNGDIDVTIPEKAAANIALSSWNGDVYSNFDIKQKEKDGLKSFSDHDIKGIINGGGVNIKLKSTNGTIYLRKEE
jgi:predicted membrane protein